VTGAGLARFLAADDDGSFCGATRHARGRHRWEVRLDASEVTRFAAATGVGRIRTIEPVERGISGRIRRLRITGEHGSAEIAGDLAIRRLLGGLRSSLFVVEPVGSPALPDGFVIRGAGFGHGVGMCQLGAIGRADQSATFQDILRHYYPGTRLHRLY
jgi:stage II sporulation protein D